MPERSDSQASEEESSEAEEVYAAAKARPSLFVRASLRLKALAPRRTRDYHPWLLTGSFSGCWRGLDRVTSPCMTLMLQLLPAAPTPVMRKEVLERRAGVPGISKTSLRSRQVPACELWCSGASELSIQLTCVTHCNRPWNTLEPIAAIQRTMRQRKSQRAAHMCRNNKT